MRGTKKKAPMPRYLLMTQELARLTGLLSRRLAESFTDDGLVRLPNGKCRHDIPGFPHCPFCFTWHGLVFQRWWTQNHCSG